MQSHPRITHTLSWILPYSGRAHFSIHSESRICLVVGRFSGLNESIGRSMSKKASLSLASNGGMSLSRLGCCTLSLNRSSQDRKGLRFIGLPSSVNFSRRASHLLHHSSGKTPRVSTCSQVMSSSVARNPSNNGRWAMIDHMVQARVQISDEKDRGSFASNRASGGRMTRGVRDSYFRSFEGEKASPKSVSKILVSESVILSLASPNHMGAMPWDGTPGRSGLPSRRTTGSNSGAPYFSYNCLSGSWSKLGGTLRRICQWSPSCGRVAAH
jgi:hypothetical protein